MKIGRTLANHTMKVNNPNKSAPPVPKECNFIARLALNILAIPYCTIFLILEHCARQLSLTTLRNMNVERKSRQQKLSQKSLLNRTAKSYFETLINFDQNPKTCARKLSCMKSLSDKCFDMKC